MDKEQDARQSLLSQIIAGYLEDAPAAYALIETLAGITQTMDDVIDGDKPLHQDNLYDLFEAMLVDLPCNPFYMANFAALQPLIAAAFQQWVQANDIEQSGSEALFRVSYVERSALTPVILHVIYLVRGRTVAREAARAINPLIFDEPFEHYRAEHLAGGGDGLQEQEGEADAGRQATA